MAHVRKHIKGRHYWYFQKSYRVGKKVKTHSTYIGPVGMAFGALKVAAKMANNKHLRDQVFKELDLKGRAARERIDKAFDERTVVIDGLKVAKEFTREDFEREGKENSAPFRGAETNQSSSETLQSSQSETPSDPAK